MKSANMNSTTGRNPISDIPRATPVKLFSQIGVLMTRCGPNRSIRPALVLKTPPSLATSSPISRTAGSASISSMSAALIASRYVISTVAKGAATEAVATLFCVDIVRRLLEIRNRRFGGALGRGVDLALHVGRQLFLGFCG